MKIGKTSNTSFFVTRKTFADDRPVLGLVFFFLIYANYEIVLNEMF